MLFRSLAGRYGTVVLVKGGHLAGRHSVDVFCDGRHACDFAAPRVRRVKTHGTGCRYSAAIAGYLALGYNLLEAVGRAKVFITREIQNLG